MSKNNFGYKSIREIHNLYSSKEVSPVEVIEETLENIESLNITLNAFVTITDEYALKKAKEAEKKILSGEELNLLTGIPIPIKDVEPMKDFRCTFGSLPRDGIATEDSMVVRRVKESDGIIIGKTNTPEYGQAATSDNRVFGSTYNPWNEKNTSGGSSGGSAASVAAGITSISQGGDGGGSIRIPASFCGVYGIKPTQGRIPRIVNGSVKYNVVNNALSGPITRHVEDSAILLEALSGYSSEGEYITINESRLDLSRITKKTNFKIGFSKTIGGARLDKDISESINNAMINFDKEYDSKIDEIDFYPESIEEIYNIFFDFFCTKGYASDPELIDNPEIKSQVTDYLIRNWEHGKKVTGSRLFECYNKIGYYRDYLNNFFKNYDFLITPTMATTAFEVNKHPQKVGGENVNDELWDFTPFTYYFNLTGNPAATIPVGFDKNMLPIGLQIVGDMGKEFEVLQISKLFEELFKWPDAKAKISV